MTISPATVWLVLGVALTATLVALVLSWAVLKAGKHPAPTMLVLAVSLLSITALIGGLVLDNDSALAIASAGLGALAGAVSSTFTIQPRFHRDQPPDDGADR